MNIAIISFSETEYFMVYFTQKFYNLTIKVIHFKSLYKLNKMLKTL